MHAFEQSQEQRSNGRLVEAFQNLTACAQVHCPQAVKDRCTDWRRDLEQALPSIVIALVGPTGQDLVDATVEVDGKLVATKLDGSAIFVDPGKRTITIQMKNAQPLIRNVVVRQGEKYRQVKIDLSPQRMPPPQGMHPGWGYGAPVAPPPPPDELDYDEGDPIPPNYEVDTKVRKGLVIAGSVTLGSLWAISALTGGIVGAARDADDKAHYPLYFPVAGPWVALGTLANDTAARVFLAIDGVGQTGAAAMFVAGIAAPKTILRLKETGLNVVPTACGMQACGSGLTLTGRF